MRSLVPLIVFLSGLSVFADPLPKPSKEYSRGGWDFTEHNVRPEIVVRKRVFEPDPRKMTYDIYLSRKEWEWGENRIWSLSCDENGFSFNPGPATKNFDTAVSLDPKTEGLYYVDIVLPNHSHYIAGFIFEPTKKDLRLLSRDEITIRLKHFGPDSKYFMGDKLEEAVTESTGGQNE